MDGYSSAPSTAKRCELKVQGQAFLAWRLDSVSQPQTPCLIASDPIKRGTGTGCRGWIRDTAPKRVASELGCIAIAGFGEETRTIGGHNLADGMEIGMSEFL